MWIYFSFREREIYGLQTDLKCQIISTGKTGQTTTISRRTTCLRTRTRIRKSTRVFLYNSVSLGGFEDASPGKNDFGANKEFSTEKKFEDDFGSRPFDVWPLDDEFEDDFVEEFSPDIGEKRQNQENFDDMDMISPKVTP